MAWFRPSRSRPVLPAHQWLGLTRRQRLARWLRAWKPWFVLALLLLALSQFDRLFSRFLPAPPPPVAEAVAATFIRCGTARAANCVVDGDTFHLGPRRIRIAGIDAPELHPARCPAEAQLGEAAAAHLVRLLNAGPFTLSSPSATAFDDYGREVRSVWRTGADGKVVSLGDALIATGTVRPFLRGQRGAWCP